MHSRKRRLLGGPISEGSLIDTFEPQVRAKTDRAVQRIVDEMRTKGVSDVLKWNLFMATDTIGELSFGSSFDMLEIGKKDQYAHDLEFINEFGAYAQSIPKITMALALLRIPGFALSFNLPRRMNAYAATLGLRCSRAARVRVRNRECWSRCAPSNCIANGSMCCRER